tara:strand:+ start:263 stop:787 length:525 start_codon:yes stop_codon:yes gene_type:complete
MTQQFTIQSESLRDKLNSLLPSQNLGSIGVELTGSTQVIPIVDLTETAEGSNVREDLQTAISHGSATVFNVNNTTTTIINTTGYFRLIGVASCESGSSSAQNANITLNDGTTDKVVWAIRIPASTTANFFVQDFDMTIFLKAGDSCKLTCTGNTFFRGSSRQIADLTGNLVNPT